MAVPSPLSQPRRMWDGTGDWPHATEAAHVPLLPLSSSLPGALTMTAGCPGPVHPRLLALPGAEVGIWGGRSSGGGGVLVAPLSLQSTGHLHCAAWGTLSVPSPYLAGKQWGSVSGGFLNV